MAPRAYWKGYLKLSLVSCPIALFPATSEREKISFHQINKNTGHRIKYRRVDAETGDEVDSADIVKGYEVGRGEYIELDPGALVPRHHAFPLLELVSERTMTHMLFVRSSGVGEDHVFGRKLVLESCRRSSDVNFHFWLWAASSTNVRCRALRAAWTISVSSKSLMLRRIGTW